MTKDQIKAAEDVLFSDAAIGPKAMAEQFAAHDKRMHAIRDDLSLHKHAAATHFWDWVDDAQPGTPTEDSGIARMLDRVEVNRIKPALTGYLAALFPRGMRAVVAATARTTGKPEIAQLALNDWLQRERCRERMMLGARQGLMYGAAGAKMGYDPDDGRPATERVWWRVFPIWQLLLDSDAHDWDDQRFIGHIHYRPLRKVESTYGLEAQLSGVSRDDFLSVHSGATRTSAGTAQKETEAASDRTQFVRVAEVCNLLDTIEVNGRLVRGRLEVYLMDQAGLDLPVFMGPLPMCDETGHAMSHICELIFDYEAEYPFRAVPYVRQLMPQQSELNIGRSQSQQASRRDARIYIIPKGALTPDQKTDLQRGEDGAIIEYDPEKYTGDPQRLVVAVQHQPVSPNIRETTAAAAADLDRGLVQSPAALGVVTNATKYEVQAVEAHTQSEFGRCADQRDIWVRALCRRYLRALVDAMSSPAGHDQPAPGEVAQIPAGTTPVEPAEPVEPADPRDADEDIEDTDQEPEPATKTDDSVLSEDAEEADAGAVEAEASEEGEVAEVAEPVRTAPLILLDENGAKVEVHVEDIDSAFNIGFTETGRTPMADAEQRQNLIALKDQYLALIAEALKGGAFGAVALAYAKAIATRFDFPNDLEPDTLLTKAREAEAAQPRRRQNGAGAPAAGMAALAAMPPDEALAQLEAVAGNDPTLGPAIARAKTMPPEARAQAVRVILSAMSGGGGGAGEPTSQSETQA